MGGRGAEGLSFTERADMRSRRKAGYHVREIARVFERYSGFHPASPPSGFRPPFSIANTPVTEHFLEG
jgi:hypothetical protein